MINGWQCECSKQNPLIKRYCTSCGVEIPLKIVNEVFEEEYQKTQNEIRIQRIERGKKHVALQQKIMTKYFSLSLVATIALVVGLCGLYYYFGYLDLNYCNGRINAVSTKTIENEYDLISSFSKFNEGRLSMVVKERVSLVEKADKDKKSFAEEQIEKIDLWRRIENFAHNIVR